MKVKESIINVYVQMLKINKNFSVKNFKWFISLYFCGEFCKKRKQNEAKRKR